jgi:hypothetical protein
MTVAFRIVLLLAVLASGAPAGSVDVAVSTEAAHDTELSTDPTARFWSAARAIYAERDKYGRVVPGYRSEVRSRWTRKYLYFLFSCPYEQLFLKPGATTAAETNALWNWDVAEAFIGSDFDNIRRYKEFELSPQGEWLDLDIDLTKPHHEDGWTWNSNFQVAARIDQKQKIWYGAMKIPWAALGGPAPAPGKMVRVNFFRSQGAPPNRKDIAWQPTMSETFHVPERFALLRLTRH